MGVRLRPYGAGMARIRRASPVQRRRAAIQRRDGAYTRLSGITAGIGIGAIAAVGVLGVYVGRALPGHHSAPANSAGSGLSQSPAASTGNTGTQGINPPSTPVQNTPAPAPVTSGAS